MAKYHEYFEKIIKQCELEPRDDLISVLIRAQAGDSALQPQEIITFGLTLLIAENETTTNLIEETLRFESPLQFVFRRVCREVEIAGTILPKDTIVMPLIGSANRDERCFERPDEFDVGRSDLGHLSFGFGPHFCMGASLARLEARVTIEALLDDLPKMRRSSGNHENVDSFMLRGPRRLELEWI